MCSLGPKLLTKSALRHLIPGCRIILSSKSPQIPRTVVPERPCLPRGPAGLSSVSPPLCFLPHNTVTHSSVNAEHLGGLAMSGQSELSWQIPMKCHSAAALSIQALSDSHFSCSSLCSSPHRLVCFSPSFILVYDPFLCSVNQIIKSWQLQIRGSGYWSLPI